MLPMARAHLLLSCQTVLAEPLLLRSGSSRRSASLAGPSQSLARGSCQNCRRRVLTRRPVGRRRRAKHCIDSRFCVIVWISERNETEREDLLLLSLGHSIEQVVSRFNIGSNYPAYIGYCPNEMRTDVGSIPLMCLLSTLTSSVLGYLPNEDLTNSIIPGGGFPPGETIIPTEVDESEGGPDEETDPEGGDSIYRKKVSTFRRRNINAPFGGRVPFSRMAYKAGYGSNRIGFSRNANIGSPLAGYYGERNPYGTVNIGSSFPPHGGVVPEEYNMRPSAPYSGLIGGSRAGYYGSTVGMRRGTPTAMSSRKPKLPATEYPPDYASNDLMNSFNGGNPAIPSLRELATYASRYGPAYLRERFGAHESGMERLPYGGSGGPQVPPRGGGMPIDFNMNIASNQWNKGVGAPIGIMSRDVDSYQHDDATKANNKKTDRSTTTTGSPSTTRKPRKARKPAKKTSTAAPASSTTTTTKPEKAAKKAN